MESAKIGTRWGERERECERKRECGREWAGKGNRESERGCVKGRVWKIEEMGSVKGGAWKRKCERKNGKGRNVSKCMWKRSDKGKGRKGEGGCGNWNKKGNVWKREGDREKMKGKVWKGQWENERERKGEREGESNKKSARKREGKEPDKREVDRR